MNEWSIGIFVISSSTTVAEIAELKKKTEKKFQTLIYIHINQLEYQYPQNNYTSRLTKEIFSFMLVKITGFNIMIVIHLNRILKVENNFCVIQPSFVLYNMFQQMYVSIQVRKNSLVVPSSLDRGIVVSSSPNHDILKKQVKE